MVDLIGPVNGKTLNVGELDPGSRVKVFFGDDFQEPLEFKTDTHNPNQIRLKGESDENDEVAFSIRAFDDVNTQGDEGTIVIGRGLMLQDGSAEPQRKFAQIYSAPVEFCVIRPA